VARNRYKPLSIPVSLKLPYRSVCILETDLLSDLRTRDTVASSSGWLFAASTSLPVMVPPAGVCCAFMLMQENMQSEKNIVFSILGLMPQKSLF
jgi:hypothetical protein